MSKSVKTLLAVGAVALVILIVCLSLLFFHFNSASSWQEQYDLGVRYLSEGNYQEAIIAFTAAIEIDPKQSLPYIGRGDAYIGSGENAQNLSSAQADYEAAIALDEADANAWLGLADVHIRRGDYDKAMEVLQEALDKTGNDPAVADKLAQVESGNISDSFGNSRRTSVYDGNGVLIWRHDMTYNEQGQQMSVTAYDGSGNQTGHIDLAYDERGNCLVSYSYGIKSGSLIRLENEYDAEGNRIKYYRYENGKLSGYVQSTYDEAGREIREDTYSPDGELKSYGLIEYDTNGNLTKYSVYTASGELEHYYIYQYNERNQLISQNGYDKDGVLIWKEVDIHDEQGKLVRTEYYDGEGNLTQTENY